MGLWKWYNRAYWGYRGYKAIEREVAAHNKREAMAEAAEEAARIALEHGLGEAETKRFVEEAALEAARTLRPEAVAARAAIAKAEATVGTAAREQARLEREWGFTAAEAEAYLAAAARDREVAEKAAAKRAVTGRAWAEV